MPELEVATVPGKDTLRNLARALITTKKAFALGLTNQVILGTDLGDPHGAFNNVPGTIEVIRFLGMFQDRFYEDLATVPDPACTSQNLDRTVILTVHGDTPKHPFVRSGWPDATPGSVNWLYVMGNGWLPSGWHGQVRLDSTVGGIDPTTGFEQPYNATTAAHAASAAVLYAVVKGDMKRVRTYYKGPDITALVKPAT